MLHIYTMSYSKYYSSIPFWTLSDLLNRSELTLDQSEIGQQAFLHLFPFRTKHRENEKRVRVQRMVQNTLITCVHFMVKQEQKGGSGGTDIDLVSHKVCCTVVSQCELLVRSEWDTSASQYHINPLLTVTVIKYLVHTVVLKPFQCRHTDIKVICLWKGYFTLVWSNCVEKGHSVVIR